MTLLSLPLREPDCSISLRRLTPRCSGRAKSGAPLNVYVGQTSNDENEVAKVLVVAWHDGVSPSCWEAVNVRVVERMERR
jgi:hypothetical protein